MLLAVEPMWANGAIGLETIRASIPTTGDWGFPPSNPVSFFHVCGAGQEKHAKRPVLSKPARSGVSAGHTAVFPVPGATDSALEP